MRFESAQNDSDEILENSAQGVWTDHRTFHNRYDDLRQGLYGRADFEEEEELDILDVGCSSGEAIEYFAEQIEQEYEVDVNVVGYDIGDEVVDEAMEEGKVDEGYQGKAQDMSVFEDDEFDIVTSKTLLSRISGDQQTDALREIERVVDTQGYAAVQIDSSGGDDPVTGTGYVMTGEEMSDVSDQTSGFSDYSIAQDLQPFQARDHFPEQETSNGTNKENSSESQGFIESTSEVAQKYEQDVENNSDDDIIVA